VDSKLEGATPHGVTFEMELAARAGFSSVLDGSRNRASMGSNYPFDPLIDNAEHGLENRTSLCDGFEGGYKACWDICGV
jgi:hypothetical protein